MKYSDKQYQFLVQDFCKIFFIEGSHDSLASAVTMLQTGRSDVQFPAEAKRPSPSKSPDVTEPTQPPEGKGPSLAVKWLRHKAGHSFR
jgi:hypothetical protein